MPARGRRDRPQDGVPGRAGLSAPARARACAYAVLRRVFEQGAYADLALRSEARDLDARDRALAMRLAYGAVQRRGTLDHLVERLAERPAGKLDAPLLAALRLGLYELLYMGGAPDHAVVADAVELAKAGRGGHGLVNAVLRRATREGTALLEELDDATPERAAIKHSHPEWIARLWWEELGADDARALLAFDNEPGELALRVNTLVADPETVAAQLSRDLALCAEEQRPAALHAEEQRPAALHAEEQRPAALHAEEQRPEAVRGGEGRPVVVHAESRRPVAVHGDPRIPEALVLEGPWDVHGSPQWRAGAVLAQSRAAMLPARALAPGPGGRVLDLCAAPGGKTTHLAALMEGRGEVVAVERNRHRAAELQRTVERLSAQACVRVVLGDAAAWPGGQVDEAPFDRVLVDPPCSGLGTLQARADLRWRVTPKDMTQLARIQAGILAAGAAAVRPGGVLVYSTCTISPTENQHQISTFLESNPDFALEDLGAELPDLRLGIGRRAGQAQPTGAVEPADPAGRAGAEGRADSAAERCVLTLPHRDRTAGFFIARLRRG